MLSGTVPPYTNSKQRTNTKQPNGSQHPPSRNLHSRPENERTLPLRPLPPSTTVPLPSRTPRWPNSISFPPLPTTLVLPRSHSCLANRLGRRFIRRQYRYVAPALTPYSPAKRNHVPSLPRPCCASSQSCLRRPSHHFPPGWTSRAPCPQFTATRPTISSRPRPQTSAFRTPPSQPIVSGLLHHRA